MQGKALSGQPWAFDTLYTHLTFNYGYPVLPNPSPNSHDTSLAEPIADLGLHPTLESVLHILNSDLPGAHFLCRHMQNKPAWEGMYIHGLLHRVEGDYENTKIWYRQVSESKSGCFEHIWGNDEEALDRANKFLDEVKMLKDETPDDAELQDRLDKQSKKEVDALVDWCKRRFGTGRFEDAESDVWTESSEEQREIAAKMIVGGEGWRQF